MPRQPAQTAGEVDREYVLEATMPGAGSPARIVPVRLTIRHKTPALASQGEPEDFRKETEVKPELAARANAAIKIRSMR